MVLNTWSISWKGHTIEVRNHCFLAELLVDGELLDAAPGFFRHDLKAAIQGPCSACADCGSPTRKGARFCQLCGAVLHASGQGAELLATVEARFPPPRVICNLSVDGQPLLRET